MYHYALIDNGRFEETEMRDKVLLETGCGRGGGLNYLATILRPHQVIGVDNSRANIEFCRQQWPKGHHVSVEFIQGDSEKLSSVVPRHSVDCIVDIEAFFYYQDKNSYFREAHSVLKEDGRLFMAFFIQRTRLEEIHNFIRQYFDILKEDDITENALHSLRLDSQKLSRFADTHYPMGKFLFLDIIPLGINSMFKQFWGIEGSMFHGLLANRTFIYKSFVLRKRHF